MQRYSNTYGLEQLINDKMSLGWKPIGGVSVIRGLTEDTSIQAMVRESDA